MKEYSQRTVKREQNLGKTLTEWSKKGWDVLHAELGSVGTWHIILVRDSEEAEDVEPL